MSELVRKISSAVTFTVVERDMATAVQRISATGLLLNIFLLYGFGASSYIITAFTGPVRRGFFCDDDSIRYLFKENTIPSWTLITVSIATSIVAIMICEWYILAKLEKSIERPEYRWRNSHIHAFFIESMVYFGYSQIGFIVNLVLTQITKYTVGRLRPHFLDVCKPTNFTCTTEHDYISDYVCTGIPTRIKEGRLSFFSGHSSTAMYSAVFVILYLQSRLGGRLSARLVLPVVQTIVFTFALVTCYSRVSDNWHHPTDVVTGAAVGALVAIYTTVFWGGMFSHRHRDTPLGDPTGVRIVTDEISNERRRTATMTTTVYPHDSVEEDRERAGSSAWLAPTDRAQ